MNILVCSSVWAPSVGGIQSVSRTLARGLGAELETSNGSAAAVTVATTAAGSETRDGDESYRVVRGPGFFGLLRLIWKSDIVDLAGPSLVPLALAWLLRKRVVVHHHGYQCVCPDGSLVHFVDQCVCLKTFATGGARDCLRCRTAKLGWLRGLRSVALAYPRLWLCRHAAANIAVSQHVNDRLGLPRTTTIYNACADDWRAAFPAALAATPSADSTRGADLPLIVFVGRLTTEKGVPILLRAAAALAKEGVEFRLRIIGDGPERGSLAVLAWTLGLRDLVEFTGVLEGAALEAAISGATAIVLPSVAEEAAGLVAMEQMMRGRVVIASDTGGLGEIVGNAGLIFPPGNIPALADCLRRVLADPQLRIALGNAARSRALEHFTRQRMVEDHLEIYCRILERRSRIPFPLRVISRKPLPGGQKRAS